jgi:chloride channel protein, CIC family
VTILVPPVSTFFGWLGFFYSLVTTLGGLLSGFLVYTFAPEAEGHGTDAAVEAYRYKGGGKSGAYSALSRGWLVCHHYRI